MRGLMQENVQILKTINIRLNKITYKLRGIADHMLYYQQVVEEF